MIILSAKKTFTVQGKRNQGSRMKSSVSVKVETGNMISLLREVKEALIFT